MATGTPPLEVLRDPLRVLPAFGEVVDQKTGTFVKYDPTRITGRMHLAVLSYYSKPPRTPDGQTKFYTVVGARQTGKSLVGEYASYVKAAYTPGWDHACIADTKDRAEYLHKRVHQLHSRWPEALRAKTIPSHESRQITFDLMQGGKMRVLSAETGAVGLGQAPDSFHASECFEWADFGGSMTLIWPSLINRDHALVLFEATPWEAGTDWHEHCLEAKMGSGRHVYAFFPFWDGRLNRRAWPKGEVPDIGEQRMLDRYGARGLTLDNLAFRRLMLTTDRQLRRRPELFDVWYPSDDVGCWIASTGAAIPRHAVEPHQRGELRAWKPPYMEYEGPAPGGVYVIGVDPCGHAARDHAAFQVFRLVEGRWSQVACFADHTDPVSFSRKLGDVGVRYGKATIVVESNGVGQSVIALLREWGYDKLFYEKPYKPGFTTTSKSLDQMLSWLTDALMDELVLRDEGTVEQLLSYKNDKRMEEGVNSELARGEPTKRRRDRGHWDKVSALMMMVVGARRESPQRLGIAKGEQFAVGEAPVHTGFYRADTQARKWREMRATKRGGRASHWS